MVYHISQSDLCYSLRQAPGARPQTRRLSLVSSNSLKTWIRRLANRFKFLSVAVTRHAMISRFQFSFVMLVRPLSNSHESLPSPIESTQWIQHLTSLNWPTTLGNTSHPRQCSILPEDSAQTASSLGLGSHFRFIRFAQLCPLKITQCYHHPHFWLDPSGTI